MYQLSLFPRQHHTGTGYLRQTLRDALNDEFAIDINSPVASIHDGTFPYLQGLSSTRRFPSPEDEGQHFQSKSGVIRGTFSEF